MFLYSWREGDPILGQKFRGCIRKDGLIPQHKGLRDGGNEQESKGK